METNKSKTGLKTNWRNDLRHSFHLFDGNRIQIILIFGMLVCYHVFVKIFLRLITTYYYGGSYGVLINNLICSFSKCVSGTVISDKLNTLINCDTEAGYPNKQFKSWKEKKVYSFLYLNLTIYYKVCTFHTQYQLWNMFILSKRQF